MPVQAFTDPDTVHNPASGTAAPATWFTTHEANFRSIVGRVGARIYQDAAQSFAGAPSVTTATLSKTDFNNGMTLSTANTIIVPSSYAGKYLINACIRVLHTSASSGQTGFDIVVNGTSVFVEVPSFNASSNFYGSISATTVQTLAVSDAITLSVQLAFGSTSAASEITSTYTSLSAIWLSA